MLEEIEHESLPNFLIAMIDHPEPFVRKDVLTRMARLGMISACDHVAKRIDAEKDPEVKGMALKTFCDIGETDVFDLVFPFLNSNDPALRKGAMIGLLSSGGIEGVLAAGEVLTAMIHSHNSMERRLSAEILGDIGIRLFHRPLIQLLQDDDIDVKRAALTAAGKLGNPRLWPLVIENLTLPEVGQTAFAALILGGESALDALSESFARRDQSHKIRKRIVQIFARIKSPASIRFLLENIDFPDVNIRHQILRALSACEFRADSSQKELIKSKIFGEVKETVWALGVLTDIGQGEAFVILTRALQYEIDCAIDRIMLLLSFIYPSEAIRKAYESLKHVSSEKRAYALEAFDNLLPQDLKNMIFPLIDDIQLTQRLKHLDPLFPQKSHGKLERLSEIVARPSASASAWSQTCGLYIMGQLGHEQFAEIVTPALASSIEMVRETAVWTLGRISPDDLGERIRHLIDDSSAKVTDITRSILKQWADERL
jgi:HEAT repeat protein